MESMSEIGNQSKSKCYLRSRAEGLGLMNSHPEVKRTYSRITKNIASDYGDDLHNTNRFRSTEEKKEDTNININRYDREHEHVYLQDSINFNRSPDCVETVKVVDSIKRVKITDFFKKEHKPSREDEENEYNTGNTNSSAISTLSSSRSCTDKTNSPRTKLGISQNKKDTRTQMFLDLGQTNFVSKQCEECLMHFNASFSEDVQLHRRFHANYLKGFTFTLLNKNKNKKKDEQSSIKEILLPQSHYCKKNLDLIKKFKIYSIESFGSETVSSASSSSASASVMFKRMESFMDFLHVQLGAEPLTYDEMRRGKYSAMFMTEASSDKIVGFALFEEIQSSFKSKIGCDSSAIELEDQQQDNCQKNSTDTDTKIKIGVSRIWVDKMFRNRSIGTILLDLKCSNIRSLIAFSQPTPIGFLFAKSYQKDLFNSLQCLLYTK